MALLGALHYYLPQVDIVSVVDAENKRFDSFETSADRKITLDIYRIHTETLDGWPSVYRNEDVILVAKIDAADLQTQMQSWAADKSVVAIPHYGWLILLLSMFPNTLSAWPVEEDCRHIPVFSIVFLMLLASGVSWTGWKLRMRRLTRAQLRAEERASVRAAEASERLEKEKKDRADIDVFRNSKELNVINVRPVRGQCSI